MALPALCQITVVEFRETQKRYSKDTVGIVESKTFHRSYTDADPALQTLNGFAS